MLTRRSAMLLAWLCIVLMVIIGARARLSHPTLTETQLILELWPQWLVVLILAIAAILFSRVQRT